MSSLVKRINRVRHAIEAAAWAACLSPGEEGARQRSRVERLRGKVDRLELRAHRRIIRSKGRAA